MVPEAFVGLEGEARDGMPGEREYQMGTTIPVWEVVAAAEEEVHTTVEQGSAAQRGGKIVVGRRDQWCWHLYWHRASSALEAAGVALLH